MANKGSHAIQVPNRKKEIVPVGRRLQFSADASRPQPGSLLQSSKGLFLLLLQGDQTTIAFAVQDGKIQEVGHPYVVIQEWKIVTGGSISWEEMTLTTEAVILLQSRLIGGELS